MKQGPILTTIETESGREAEHNMEGYVMNMQPFSVNDGDGIRTTVFLAGCPLRCEWCSNPEGQKQGIQIGWYMKKCIGCGACTAVCPQQIGIDLHGERKAGKECIACGQCADVCPKQSRVRMTSRMDSEDILKEVQKHRLFFQYSGGGVTFSGGEAAMQPELLEELSAEIYDMGYDMALETCGFFEFEAVRETLARMDLIFMDLKLMDDERHRRYTGRSNQLILENMMRLRELPAGIVIRIPVIGGVNDDEENIRASAAFVREHLPEASMELLPYHEFGKIKYEALGMEYKHDEFGKISKEELACLEELVREEGVEIVRFR